MRRGRRLDGARGCIHLPNLGQPVAALIDDLELGPLHDGENAFPTSVPTAIFLLLTAADDVDGTPVGAIQQAHQFIARLDDPGIRIHVPQFPVDGARECLSRILSNQPIVDMTQVVSLLIHVLGQDDIRRAKSLRLDELRGSLVIFFVNVDFWEAFWLARRQTGAMFAYTAGRLIGRMLIVVAVAMATRDVNTIILALVGLEGLRLVISAIAWRAASQERSEPKVPDLLKEQLHFCVPAGVAMILTQTNRSLGNLAVVKYLGAASLAQFTIGTYGEPIVIALRNSLSTALLPEMVRRNAASGKDTLSLWQKTTVVNCLLVVPAAVVLARYAGPLVTKVFGSNYVAAVPVLQIYGFAMLRSCFDFSPPLRSIGKTRPLVMSNVAAIVSNSICLLLLLPTLGITGAMIARVVSGFFDGAYLGWAVTQIYGVPIRQMLPWRSLAKLLVSAILAAVVLIGDFWTSYLGFFGIVAGSLVYAALFTVLILAWRIPEAETLLAKAKAVSFRFSGLSKKDPRPQ